MTVLDVQKAAEILLENRKADSNSSPRLAAELRPTTIDDALQIQSQMIALNPSSVGGWKCLLPFDNKVIVAPIFVDGLQSGDECALFADNTHARVEPEIAFVLNTDLPARGTEYSLVDIDAAIGSCHMALELIQSRFVEGSDTAFLEALADGLLNQGLYLGPEIKREQAFTASEISIYIEQPGQTNTFNGVHPNQQPVSPIYWLINFLTQRGVSFKKGQAIITGSYCGVVDLAFDQETTITYTGIGEYTVTMKKKAI